MNILFSLCGDQNKASSRVRGFWIADALEKENTHCILQWNHDKMALLQFALKVPRQDVIIFQKTYSRYHRWLMILAKILRKRCYLDIDDAPSKVQSTKTLRNFESMASMADGVFAGSNNLVDYCKKFQPNTYLIPSSINLKHYKIKDNKLSEKICLGWIGNGTHYKKDLINILFVPLKNLSAKHSIKFKIVGACGEQELYDVFGAIEGLELDFIDSIDWSDPTAISDAINNFDIGLYPLLPNDFNHFKCGFKALEYMAIGIPVVSSNVAENQEIITHGEEGLLVDSSEEWIAALNELILSEKKRKQMGMAGLYKVDRKYNVINAAKQIRSIVALEK